MAKKITLTIQGMECPNCAMKLEGIEDKLTGVLRAEASYQKGLMTVEYNEAQVNEAQIQAAVQRLGYEVTAVHPTKK
jgi:copper chaperone CopZ